jgi:serine kinase of HPr protein (carbohydrate metabolism regulator)
MSTDELFHATCLIVKGKGVLLSGRSGSGKSDLALRLIDRGAKLISDDYTMLQNRDGRLIGSPPPNIAGKIEVRGIGLIEHPFEAEAIVHLLVTLDGEMERMPPEMDEERVFVQVALPVLKLRALEPSAPIKVELATRLFSAYGIGT